MDAVVHFFAEWTRRPTAWANVGMILGVALFLLGVMAKNRRDQVLGLATFLLSLIVGLIEFAIG